MFNKTIAFLSFRKSIITKSFSSKAVDESITYIIKSALTAYSFAFSTPICSITSEVSLIPAVSIRFRIIPLRLICSSNTSLVVPAISVTIARSVPTKALSKEDLPAFGFPRITVLIPSFKIFPLSEVSSNFCILDIFSEIIEYRFTEYPSRETCSGSSRADSIKAIS